MKTPKWSTDTRFFMDTSSLMADAAAITTWQFIVPACRRCGVPPPIVTISVFKELDRLARSKTRDKKTLLSAKAACCLVKSLQDNDFITLIGDDADDSFADHVFLYKFTELRRKYQLVLFTQDKDLAQNTLAINNHSSVKWAKHIEVFRVGNDGAPMRWELSDKHRNGVKYRRIDPLDGFETIKHLSSRRVNQSLHTNRRESSELGQAESSFPRPFALRKQVVCLRETPIDTIIPVIGDKVKNSDGISLKLTNSLGAGGEGTAFETDDPQFVCKIYRRDHLKESSIKKLELMTSRTIHHRTICWPVSIVYNVEGRGVGYIMPRATGRELRSIFVKPLLLKSFPHWTRLHVVKLTATILNAVTYLHKMNVLLGDVNAGNILVRDETTVYFVDCDSYQIEGFPCPVGMAPFLATELYGKELRSTLRTMKHEHFAISTLVFMLMHPGKPPYSHQGGGDPLKNVQTRHFPYQRASQGSQNAPDGPWRYMFSHLPRYMKDAFHDVFSDGKQKTVIDWQKLVERYLIDLGKGYVSDELYPMTFKKLTEEQAKKWGVPWQNCRHCGKGFAAKKNAICPDCFPTMRHNTSDTQSGRLAQSSRLTEGYHRQEKRSIAKNQPQSGEPAVAELWKAFRSLF